MTHRSKRRSTAVLVGLAVSSLALAACGNGGSGGGGDGKSITFHVDNGDTSVALGNALADAFHKKNPGITVKVDTRPQGGDGDNIVKTRLSTGDMSDVFMYNSGSLFQALNPADTLVPAEGDWTGNLDKTFAQTVTAKGKVYGAPFQGFFAGGVLYNIPLYKKLGLSVPKTWAEFEANNAKVKAAGKTPVIQTYGDTWTSQLFVLGDFANVAAAEPNFADDYTAGKAKYADTPAATLGFEHLQEAHDKGWLNENFASAKNNDGLTMVANGDGAHYPMLTAVLPAIVQQTPDKINDVGFFALPGDNASANPLTVWAPAGVYIPKSTEGGQLTSAKKFQAYVASQEGCQIAIKTVTPTGPMAVKGCDLPADVPQAVKDQQAYFGKANGTSPALEFLSPIKGPALEQICVEVGSGIRPAKDGAALYDEDAKKQAQQLGIEGW
jgi:raffinose/stachyose/melibiose transport system substrate-binding protein